METIFETVILPFLMKYPEFGTFLFIMSILRSVFKPLISVWQAYVEATPGDADNKKMSEVMGSQAWAFIKWFIDFFASIKVDVVKKK